MNAVSMIALLASLAAEPTGDFVLKEHLGRNWTQECVSFPVTANLATKANAGIGLLGTDGKAVAYQLVPGEGGAGPRICFQTDLPAFGVVAFRFGDKLAAVTSDLKVEEGAELVTVTNGRIGLKVRRKWKEGFGPIAGLRLASGAWTGESLFSGATAAVESYQVVVRAKGPVFAAVECRVTFADQGTWKIAFRVESGEPVVLVDESFDAPSGGVWSVVLGASAFRPTHMLHRNADVNNIAVMSDLIAPYHLEPWLKWSNPRHGTWVALHSPPNDAQAASSDMLMIGLMKPSLWVDPQWKGKAKQPAPFASAVVRDGLVAVDFALGGGRRAWMLGALDQTESVAILSQANRRVAPPPQKLLIKHGDFPLDKVKDFVLEWAGDHDNHPRLYVRKRDIPALRTRIKSDPKELARWTGQQPIDKYLLDGPIREFIASGDPRLGQLMAARAEEYLQTCVDWYLKQDERLTPGAAPHMQTLILSVVNLIDPVLSESFTPEARRRVLARLAFLGYVVSSPDYWSPERGFSGFANMTSVVAMYRTALGCLLPSHPHAKGWAELGLNQLTWQLEAWSDEDGGWIEAPHYAMVSFDHLLAGFTMAANAGYSDRLFDPRMRKVIEWFAGISTPRDARIGGWRHQPPIGNTYHGEPNGVYGIAAALWRERDPDFAARMQWLFEQHGSYAGLGSGWNFPTMLGYRFLMNSSGVTPKPAEFGSTWYRKTGVVLRNTMADRETYLHLIAGPNHEHYDADSGSIVLYGKGRVLADDWGYLGRHPDKWHSMLTGPAANGYSQFDVAQFAAGPAFDYVAGTKGAWERQIGFAKDPDSLGPNFFLIRDTHTADGEVTWRLWLTTGITAGVGKQMPAMPDKVPASPTASQPGKSDAVSDLLGDAKPKPATPSAAAPGTVALTAFGATLFGMEDVDLDIFLHEPARLRLALEPARLRTNTGNWMGSIEPVENAQIALTARFNGRVAVTSLLYPRLKTEPSPTVTWSADGRIAEVRTKWGTDTVFLSPQDEPPPISDGKSLVPLRKWHTADGLKTLSMAGDEQLKLYVTSAKTGLSDGTHQIPPATIALHPGPKNPATAVWQSPLTGTVTIGAKLRDGNTGGGDGILYELRHGSKLLAEGALPNGGDEVVVRTDKVTVAKGDLIRLVILPGQTNPEQSNWWDTTLVDFALKYDSGQRWNLRESLLAGESLGNQLSRDFDKAIWWICSGDAERFDPKSLAPPPVPTFTSPNGKITFQGRAASVRERSGKTTLTLGAAGSIRAGTKELSSSEPATKE